VSDVTTKLAPSRTSVAPPIVRVSALTKRYRVARREAGLAAAFASLFHRAYEDVVAVDAVSFDIAQGELVGLLGPNGAGKTTTLKMLAGLLHPTSGVVEVAGYEPRRRHREFLRSIALVMGQKRQLSWDLPALDTFDLNRVIYDVDRRDFETRLDEFVTLLDLGDVVRKPVRQLSLGERMKCELVAALLHRPRVLFLDEPTIGMDVTMQSRVRSFVREYNARHGATIILTSHYMEDVAALCSRVIVIDGGKVGFDGGIDELRRRVRPHRRVRATLPDGLDVATPSQTLQRWGAKIEAGGRIVIDVAPAEVGAVMTALLAIEGVRDLEVADAPLEDVMREMFERGVDGEVRSTTASVASDVTKEPGA
jgi:ABC-2 type transport system ATP-binding protein